MYRIVLASFATLVAGCTIGRRPPAAERRPGEVVSQAPNDSLQAEVLAEVRRYYSDLSARDWNAFSDHFWPGATLTTIRQPPGRPTPEVAVQSVPGFVAQAPRGPGSKPVFQERMTGAEVKLYRNLAQVWARYTARFGDATDVREWQGIDALTLMKHEGRWRMVALAFTGLEGNVTDRRGAR